MSEECKITPKESNIDKMAEQFKDFSELQAYCDAQYTTIVNLNKEINKLKDMNSSLERSVQLLPKEPSGIVQFPSLSLSDEEEICISQLKILNDISKRGQLTLEEAKKVEIYTKILMGLRCKGKDVEGSFKKVSTEELLKIAGGLVADVK